MHGVPLCTFKLFLKLQQTDRATEINCYLLLWFIFKLAMVQMSNNNIE
jgi:succinate-acetate transporter protein